MSEQKIEFEFENLASTKSDIQENGWAIRKSNVTNLDPALLAQGIERPTNCYFVVETEPSN